MHSTLVFVRSDLLLSIIVSSSNLHILKKIKSFDSEKSPNLHILKKNRKIKNQFIYAMHFEVNKAQIKNGIRFWCSFYFILLKTSNHQNKTNRVCIKHRNLQCFLSMSFKVFNATLGSDTFPPSRGRPWGGGYHTYIYTYIYIYTCSSNDLGTLQDELSRAPFASKTSRCCRVRNPTFPFQVGGYLWVGIL